MNQVDFKEFQRLEELLNLSAISPMDFWQRVRELKSVSTAELNRVERKLWTLEAQSFSDPISFRKYKLAEEIVVNNNLPKSIMEEAQRILRSVPLPEMVMTTNPSSPTAQSIMEEAQRQRLEQQALWQKNIKEPYRVAYDPATNQRKIEPRTTGERMFSKLLYELYEDSYEAYFALPKDIKKFQRNMPNYIERIEFERINGEIEFTASIQNKTNTPVMNDYMAKKIEPKELEAILQIITEWKD